MKTVHTLNRTTRVGFNIYTIRGIFTMSYKHINETKENTCQIAKPNKQVHAQPVS